MLLGQYLDKCPFFRQTKQRPCFFRISFRARVSVITLHLAEECEPLQNEQVIYAPLFKSAEVV